MSDRFSHQMHHLQNVYVHGINNLFLKFPQDHNTHAMRINKSVVLTFSICGNVPQFQCSVMATRNLKERQKRRIAGHCKGTIQATFTHMHYTRTIALTKTLHHHTPHTTHHTPHTTHWYSPLSVLQGDTWQHGHCSHVP